MNEIIKSFMKLLKALHDYHVEYVLIGGFAVALHGIERFTKDIDIFVSNEPDNVNRLKQALHSVFDDPSIDEIEVNETYPVVRYGTPDGYYLDIMNRIGEVFSYHDLDYEIIEREGIQIRIATLETMLRLKKDTIRLQDKADAEELKYLLEKRRRK